MLRYLYRPPQVAHAEVRGVNRHRGTTRSRTDHIIIKCLCMGVASAPENPIFRPLLILLQNLRVPASSTTCAVACVRDSASGERVLVATQHGGARRQWLCASLPPAAPRLEAGQDEHEGAELRSCSPCGELSLSAVRAGEPAAYKHAPVNIRRWERADHLG